MEQAVEREVRKARLLRGFQQSDDHRLDPLDSAAARDGVLNILTIKSSILASTSEPQLKALRAMWPSEMALA